MTNARSTHALREIVVNALIAALYVALWLVAATFNLASLAIQFRVSEGLNHLIVFDKRYFWGITLGVLIADVLDRSTPVLLNVPFGVGQTMISLLLVGFVAPKLPKLWMRMLLNIVVFTISMAMIAWMLHLAFQLPFWLTYLSTGLSEAFIMTITAPLMAAVNTAVHFDKVLDA
ncbi:QueT transporter family protein [Schleiferilactobacillus harbinensis]|uniref:QueT transporter family protein n=1 Tax=Schleiferilactobacillus harbinensis TaxID=304207 RepID=UPI001238D881|nr:QueT transporter family protein [Schleiferilactobacillus harbinensis]QEU45842.1 QueT transporter family protein [Schleiferilactobacillus harbinensis]